jgi:hypothetical protein
LTTNQTAKDKTTRSVLYNTMVWLFEVTQGKEEEEKGATGSEKKR